MCQELLLYRRNSTTVEVTLSRPVWFRLVSLKAVAFFTVVFCLPWNNGTFEYIYCWAASKYNAITAGVLCPYLSLWKPIDIRWRQSKREDQIMMTSFFSELLFDMFSIVVDDGFKTSHFDQLIFGICFHIFNGELIFLCVLLLLLRGNFPVRDK